MSQHTWTGGDTFELIKLYEANAMLWDKSHSEYRNREAKTEIINNIATTMNVASEEVIRKLHNLRNQLCQEIKRSRKKKKLQDSQMPSSSWQYFSAMKFLIPSVISSSRFRKLLQKEESMETDTEDYKDFDEVEKNNEKKIPADFINGNYKKESKYPLQYLTKLPDEERNMMEHKELGGIGEKCEKIPAKFLNNTYDEEPKHPLRFLSKVPNGERCTMEYQELGAIEEKREKFTTQYVNNGYDEEPRHSFRTLPKVPDEDDRFGEYVALELRSLRSEANKRRLKSEIRRAICHIADLEDADFFSPSASSDLITLHSQSSPQYSNMCEITNVRSENI